MLKIDQLDHVTITASDPERSIKFYEDVLGFKKDLVWPEELTMLRCGSMCVAIAWWMKGVSVQERTPIKIDHLAFRVDKDTFSKARKHLEQHGVTIRDEVDQGICRSLYFCDSDGNNLELACYEIKGDPGKMPTKPS